MFRRIMFADEHIENPSHCRRRVPPGSFDRLTSTPTLLEMPHRVIVDKTGMSWDVWDTRPGPRSQVSPMFRDGWLTFESIGEPKYKRRLVPIPELWDKATEADLLGHLARADEVTPGRRSAVVTLEESSAPPNAP